MALSVWSFASRLSLNSKQLKMGRAFEFRKERKFKRWAKMAVQFTRIGKDIVMAVKESGPHPETNSRLRTAMQNAKAVNMPKDRVEAAIKRASDKSMANYEEIVYEGYAPHGVAVLIETATDNTNRTVANVRSYFNKTDGSLGKTGSLDFVFSRKSIFRFAPAEDLNFKPGNNSASIKLCKSCVPPSMMIDCIFSF